MKRVWLVLLSLGLVMAFGASAFAVDVKFSGSMYAAGMYVSRTTLNDDSASNGPSTAFYFQRLRVQTEFIVAPGVSLVTRFDAMERVWGATRSTPGTTLDTASLGTKAENENIAFDYAYIQYDSPYGRIRVGAMLDGPWGTRFGDINSCANRITYFSPKFGDFSFLAVIQKNNENSYTANNTGAAQADKDADKYVLAGTYAAKSFTVGVLGAYFVNATTRTNAAADYKGKYFLLAPYAVAKIGPVAIEAEVDYWGGKFKEYDNAGAGTNENMDSLAAYIDAVATFGPVYIGGTFAYARGDKSSTDDKKEDMATGGLDWSPTLIMWNEDRAVWFGALTGNGTTGFPAATGMKNAYLYQIRVGVRPVDKLDVCASVTYSTADQVPTGYVSKDYGYEIDVTGTYKITQNLSYMLGFGYLITGDYFKATSSSNKVANDYLIINKLTLTF